MLLRCKTQLIQVEFDISDLQTQNLRPKKVTNIVAKMYHSRTLVIVGLV